MNKPANSDARILAALESGIPLEPTPFAIVAERLAMTETALLDRVKALLASGAIKRLAVAFDARALGFATTLVAARAASGKDADAVRLINSLSEVTHHYRRSGADLDLWFTLSARDRARIDDILGQLRASGLFEKLVNLPTTRQFKVDVRFSRMSSEVQHG
jgi:siroheme decarboxylase